MDTPSEDGGGTLATRYSGGMVEMVVRVSIRLIHELRSERIDLWQIGL